MTKGDEVVRGTTPPLEQKAEFDSLRTVFDAKTALDRVDGYGKWLFVSAAIVGSLGAGFSNAAFSKLHGPSLVLFAIAIAFLGWCLVEASMSIAPKWVEAYYYDLASMRNAVNTQFAERQRLLTRASRLFAVALLLAAFAPLLSFWPTKSRPSIHYSIDEKGALDAGLDASDLAAGSVVELRLVSSPSGTVRLPSTVTVVDRSGQARLSVKMANVGSVNSGLALEGCLRDPNQQTCSDKLRLVVSN